MKNKDVRIVVLQRGWVLVGRFSRDKEDNCLLGDAKCIRTWGTGKGLGELVNGPLKGTVLDDTGIAEFHYLTVVFTMRVNISKWEKYYA